MLAGEGSLLGCGWIFHPELAITSLHLQLLSLRGQEAARIPLAYGLRREDVGDQFPAFSHARASGFAFSASLKLDLSRHTPVLEARLANGAVEQVGISPLSPRVPPDEKVKKRGAGGMPPIYRLSKRALGLLASGKLSLLGEKLARYARKRPRQALKTPIDLWELLAPSQPGDVSLIVDHDLGGGATDYRERLTDSLVSEGRIAIVFSYHLATRQFMLLVSGRGLEERCSIPDGAFLLDAADRLNLGEIIYNTGVSLPHPEKLPILLLQLKARTGARLRIIVHDYFAICPSHFLLDLRGQFCHVPDPGTCAACLPDNGHFFASPAIAGDIQVWRSLWGALLASADDILTFSSNSEGYLRKAYPDLGPGRIRVLPHEVKRYQDTRIHVKETRSLSIGVVGYVNYHKGSRVVQALAREIKARRLAIPVTIIGTIDVRCEPAVVRVTGHYEPAQLPGLIERSGVNVMLFPSICAETFSYVVQELINLRLPIVAFNLGAPAERLLTYEKGLVLDSMDPVALLRNLISFHHEIYLDGPGG